MWYHGEYHNSSLGFKAGSVSLAPTCNSEFMLHMCQTVSEAAPTYERKRKAPVVEAGCHAASSHIIKTWDYKIARPAGSRACSRRGGLGIGGLCLRFMCLKKCTRIRNNAPRIGGVATCRRRGAAGACGGTRGGARGGARGSARGGAGGAWPACSQTRLVD